MKFCKTSNGNQVCIDDLAEISAEAQESALNISSPRGLAVASTDAQIHLSGVNVSILGTDTQAQSISISGVGGLIGYALRNGRNSSRTFYSESEFGQIISKGKYVYGYGQTVSYQQRTSSTGVSYYPYVKYTLVVSDTALSVTLNSDFTADTGYWLLISGAYTASLSNSQWNTFAYQLKQNWESYSYPISYLYPLTNWNEITYGTPDGYENGVIYTKVPSTISASTQIMIIPSDPVTSCQNRCAVTTIIIDGSASNISNPVSVYGQTSGGMNTVIYTFTLPALSIATIHTYVLNISTQSNIIITADYTISPVTGA